MVELKLREDRNIVSLRVLVPLMIYFLIVMIGAATVSLSGTFYNSDYSTGISQSEENANSAGFVVIMPSGGLDGCPYSIWAGGSACANGGNAPTKFSSFITASGKGKTVATSANIREDPELKPVLSEKWNYETILGNTAQGNGEVQCTLSQSIDVKSAPGYLTYPTSANIHPTTTVGMTFQAFGKNGTSLFDIKYVPPWNEFGEPLLSLGVWPTEYKNVYMDNKLEMNTKW